MTIFHRIRRGIASNAYGQCINLLLQLGVYPVIILQWGPALSTDWLLLSSATSALQLSDFGLISSVANEMSIRAAGGDEATAAKLFAVTKSLVTITALSLFLLGAAYCLLAQTSPFPLSCVSPQDANLTLLVLFASALIHQRIDLNAALYRAQGRYPTGVLHLTNSRLVEAASYLAATFFTTNTIVAALAGLCSRATILLASSSSLRSSYSHYFVKPSNSSLKILAPLFLPSIASSIGPATHVILAQGVLYAIAANFPASAVLLFSIHRTITNAPTQLTGVVNHAIWPEISRAFGIKDFQLLAKLHARCVQSGIMAGIACFALTLLFGQTLVKLLSASQVPFDGPLLAVLATSSLIRVTWRSSLILPVATNKHLNLMVVYFGLTLATVTGIATISPSYGLLAAGQILIALDTAMAVACLWVSLRIIDEPTKVFIRRLVSI